MLTKNKDFLRIKNRELLNRINQFSVSSDHVLIEDSKKGLPTIKLKQDSIYKYIHSKYDPKSEAKRLVDNFQLEGNKQHIILFGFGLGYHYEELKARYEQITFTIYEPDMNVLSSMLNTIPLERILKKDSTQIITRDSLQEQLSKLLSLYNNEIQIFTLPFYEKNYEEDLNQLYELLVSNLKNKKTNLVTNISFQKRWTLNAIKNIPTVIKTPNVFSVINHNNFKGKSAIIVAAGPSLDYEYDNLRYIKENGLAYIFSVGSAINSLIENDIYPDAACTYDPTERNQIVFEKLKNKGIKEIPLFFGSTVGYETIENYPGKMYHMITNQDSISPFLLNEDKDLKIVMDAPSIAVVTFQLLANLDFDQIILVGQNLAYKQEKIYAGGIDYAPESNNQQLIPVQDVNDEEIYTDESFNRMKQQLELYISSVQNIKVFNTTIGGAKIKGAPFLPLEELINETLTSGSVNPNWHESRELKQFNDLEKRLTLLKHASHTLNTLLKDMKDIIVQCKSMSLVNSLAIEKRLAKFDKLFKKLKNNKYYVIFIAPMLRVQAELLANQSKRIKMETDIKSKVELIENDFGSFLQEIEKKLYFVNPYVQEMMETLQKDG